MFTVTMGRSFSVLSAVAALAVASNAGAQVIVTGDGGVRTAVGTMIRRSVAISDDSVRSYLSRYEPGVLDDESGDANVVTMVLDSDGAYVRSSTRHAKVVQAMPAQVMVINGDSARTLGAAEARIVALNRETGLRTIDVGGGRVFSVAGDSLRTITITSNGDMPTTGSVVAVNTVRRLDGASSVLGGEMFGGFSPDEIGAVSTKRYAAGEMGKGQLIVTIVHLK
jgi:hypothetical protein